jgi:hypothetical protein
VNFTVITELLLILQLLPSLQNAFTELYKRFLKRHTINSNPRFATDLVTIGAEGSLLVAACSPPHPRPRHRVDLMAGSLLLLVASSLDPSSSHRRRRHRRCCWVPPPNLAVRGVVHVAQGIVWFVSQRRGVACVAAWEEVRGTKAGVGKWQRRHKGRAGEDCVRKASFPTNLAQVGLCGP